MASLITTRIHITEFVVLIYEENLTAVLFEDIYLITKCSIPACDIPVADFPVLAINQAAIFPAMNSRPS